MLKASAVAPAVGAKLGDAQAAETLALGTGATTIVPGDPGRLSVKDRLSSARLLGLLMSKRSVVGTLTATGELRKVLLMLGGASTSTLSSAAAPVVAGLLELTVLVLLA